MMSSEMLIAAMLGRESRRRCAPGSRSIWTFSSSRPDSAATGGPVRLP